MGTKRATHESPPRRPGRLRSAFQVLLGERMTPAQIQAEWIEYQQIFTDILARLGAQLARQAKYEKERVRAQVDEELPSEGHSEPTLIAMPTDRKSVLRKRAFASFGPGSPGSSMGFQIHGSAQGGQPGQAGQAGQGAVRETSQKNVQTRMGRLRPPRPSPEPEPIDEGDEEFVPED